MIEKEIRRVSQCENDLAEGKALCIDKIWQAHVKEVQSLRAREAAYRASLPTDPTEAIRAALEIVHYEGGEYPDGIEDALHLSVALGALVRHENFATDEWVRQAAFFISESVIRAINCGAAQLDRVADILKAPKRQGK